MSRLILFGATGSLGSHVLRLALAAGHQVTVFLRTPARLPLEARHQVSVYQGDLRAVAPADLAQLVSGHDALINCAGRVTEGQGFVDLVDRIVSGVDSLPSAAQPVSWFLAGAALLDIGASGRSGVDLPGIESTYWPHRANFDRLRGSGLDWRLLCPGPMVEGPALGLDRLQIALDRLPVQVPELPDQLLVPAVASLVPRLTVPYADGAALMLGNIDRADEMSRHRVGLALPPGMKVNYGGKRFELSEVR